MKKLKTYSNETEARFSHDVLASAGVNVQVVGAKEYISHVLGGGMGRFDLIVDPADVEKATEILRGIESGVSVSEEKTESEYFKRAIFFSFAAFILGPLVFNYASLINGFSYWRKSAKDVGVTMKMVMIFLLQIPGLIVAYLMITWILSWSSTP